MDLSIIIVNFNTKELLQQTIQFVIDTVGEAVKYEIIVSDNGSKDDSCKMVTQFFSNVKLIENNANLGFPKGNNIAIKEAIGRYVLLLNSDTVVKENCLEKCIFYMDEHDEVGALGCKILLADGTLDHACKRGFPIPEASLYYMLKLDKLFPNNKKFGAYTLDYLPQDETNEVDSLTGAFMMVRREIIEKVGLLDEDFFMYGEDIDWCYRIKEAGWKVVYYPEASITHYKGGSSRKKRIKTIYEFHRAMYLFYNKHYLKKYNIFITLMVYLGIGLKLILSLFINVFRRRG
jgi:GT2 family glycosyltransferase